MYSRSDGRYLTEATTLMPSIVLDLREARVVQISCRSSVSVTVYHRGTVYAPIRFITGHFTNDRTVIDITMRNLPVDDWLCTWSDYIGFGKIVARCGSLALKVAMCPGVGQFRDGLYNGRQWSTILPQPAKGWKDWLTLLGRNISTAAGFAEHFSWKVASSL